MRLRIAVTVLAVFLTALVPPALGSHHAASSGRVLLVGTWKGPALRSLANLESTCHTFHYGKHDGTSHSQRDRGFSSAERR